VEVGHAEGILRSRGGGEIKISCVGATPVGVPLRGGEGKARWEAHDGNEPGVLQPEKGG
jgi:hypothetical protein